MNTTEILFAMHILSGHFVPHVEKDSLQGINGIAFNSAVHVVPFTHNLSPFDVIVCHVHASCIGCLAVYDNDFPVVS